ncbi:sulfatase [uncultured Proteiniphilum sp.]|uniref:sulfatase n=1 Tax=uncultured Proteiniphilum sp. TaxID=497637 RepID=UPI002633CC1A|nr:sulfatase [uncultured Proteiniphilum sp.]
MRYLKQLNKLLLIGGVSTVPGLTKAQQVTEEKPRNVLMILVDDLKPNLGCYGDNVAVSPNIDRLAGQGVRFDMAYCNQAVSVASRYNLLTGARSTTSGLYNFGRQLRDVYPDAVTLPQFFIKAGYHTEAIGKVFHVGHGNTDDKASWSIPHHSDKLIEYLLPESTDRQLTREEALFENTRLFFPDTQIGRLPRGAAWEALDVVDEAYADGRVARKAIDRLRELKKEPDQPFFMAVGFVRPHLPFSAPKKYWDMYDPDKLPMPEYEKDAENAPKMATKRGGEIDQFKPIPPGQYVYADSLTRKLIHGYYASMSYMDAQVGRLLDELERLDMLDNTIIVLWGDHGWHLGDHGYWTKHTNYEQANRIPLIVVAPGVTTPGTSTGQPAETVDIYPTLTELAGLGKPVTPQPIDGLSMVPILKDPEKRIRDHAYHAYPHGKYIGRAIRTERYRLVEWKNREDSKDVLYELYDYKNDPLETKNIADKESKVVKSMQKILATHPEAKRW